ncbi:tRNA lysidine(34) synthetase TilS [Pseudomonas entomophila]|uniref:tRNA lysidine(34) synthetase TilS n=1 Tax=Pseudomonas entomophila TaxID=312306 RepID=UPI0015E3810C|nr:tRNA lysidine(34) synthetase TilS [Pseudomonas entomophila]MBA1189712.1 tRNA lysidine(34) synthetase TilS [Pseudomonas entomophila]
MLDLSKALTPWLTAPTWYVAFSGGLDSTVLLHLLTLQRTQRPMPPIRALHIHHGLQPAADAWPEQCRRVCERLGVPLEVVHVRVAPGASLEQAARSARYAAFAEVLGPGDVLFTGQHQNDQAETLLFRLLRGAGVRGLAGMPRQRPLGAGTLVRPLLDRARAELFAHATDAGLPWIEDPSNDDIAFDRNFLRAQVLPLMEQRWPRASLSLARSADHLGEALDLLSEVACDDVQQACQGHPADWPGLDSLDLRVLAGLSDARQRNALRHWLATRTRLPDSRHWAGWRTLREAAEDATPIWRLADGQVRRAFGRLWWVSGPWLETLQGSVEWPQPAASLALPGNGHVSLQGCMPPGRLRIAYRQGGERLTVAGRGQRDLKRLLNEARVPPFVRCRLPLLYADDRLLAVANLPALGQGEWRLHWQPPSCAQRLS